MAITQVYWCAVSRLFGADARIPILQLLNSKEQAVVYYKLYLVLLPDAPALHTWLDCFVYLCTDAADSVVIAVSLDSVLSGHENWIYSLQWQPADWSGW